MFLQLQQESLLLGRRPTGFTEHYYTEWDDGLGKEKISLFLLISIQSTQVPGGELAKEAFQLLQDHFLDDLSGDPYDRFENALREINLMVNEKEKDLDLKFIPNVNVIAGVVQKDMLFLSQRGEAQGYLIRKRHVSSITDGLYDEKNKEDLFQNIASGALEVGDSTIFVTGPLIQYVTPTDLSKIFSEQALSEAVKELDELLQNDLEDQMALLTFDVLERTEESVLPEKVKLGDEDEESSLRRDFVPAEDEEEEEEGRKKFLLSPRLSRLTQPLKKVGGVLARYEDLRVYQHVRKWPKKKLLFSIGVLLGVLLVGVWALSLTLGKQRVIANMEEKLDTAGKNVTLAETRGTFNKEEAIGLLESAEKLAAEVLESGYLGGRASQVLDDVAEQRDYLDNVKRVDDELKKIADLSGQIQGNALVGMEPLGDRIVAFNDHNAFQILLDQVSEPDVLDAIDNVLAGRGLVDLNILTLLTNGAKVLEYSEGNTQIADTADVTWHSGVDLGTYSNKIYILDPASNQIWRYTRGTDSYSTAQAYFSSEQDLEGAVSISVDGSVWVVKEDGSLLRYFAGEPVEYSINKAPVTSMEGASRVYTELEINQVYVLDPNDQRLFIFDKSSKNDDLTYNAQYVFEGLDEALVDFYLDKDRNVLVFLTDRAVYELSFED